MTDHQVSLTFKWEKCSGDPNEFSQQMQLFEPLGIHIVVKLDATPENFANPEIRKYWADTEVFELNGGDRPQFPSEPSPLLLTPIGANKAKELLQEAFHKSHPYKKSFEDDETVDEDDW